MFAFSCQQWLGGCWLVGSRQVCLCSLLTEIWWWKTLKTSSFFFKLVLFLEMFFITLSNFDVSVLFCLWSFIFHMMFLTSGPPCFIYWLPTSVDSLHCLPSGLQHKLSKFKLEMLDGEMLRKWRELTLIYCWVWALRFVPLASQNLRVNTVVLMFPLQQNGESLAWNEQSHKSHC